jgi:hypothetical protein
MRQHHTDQIDQVSQAVRQVIADIDRARTEAAQREVNRQLQLFLRQNQALTERTTPAYMYLVGAAQVVNAQSLKASVRRRGDWDNFDAYLHLATGAAREAQARSARFFNRLEGLLSQMMADENLEPTHRFLGRLAKSAEAWREQFVAEARQVGGEIFRAALEDADVWHDCGLQRAPDYRLKVARLLHNWFKGPPSEPDLVQALEHHVQAEWECQVLDEFRRLCEEVASCPAEQPRGSSTRSRLAVRTS